MKYKKIADILTGLTSQYTLGSEEWRILMKLIAQLKRWEESNSNAKS